MSTRQGPACLNVQVVGVLVHHHHLHDVVVKLVLRSGDRRDIGKAEPSACLSPPRRSSMTTTPAAPVVRFTALGEAMTAPAVAIFMTARNMVRLNASDTAAPGCFVATLRPFSSGYTAAPG
ncbi:MAG TPA: hypothetical protein VML01_12875 [Bryobacterales bacterium]|nr:hypothetical protein [Bryobacterales bacterium]